MQGAIGFCQNGRALNWNPSSEEFSPPGEGVCRISTEVRSMTQNPTGGVSTLRVSLPAEGA